MKILKNKKIIIGILIIVIIAIVLSVVLIINGSLKPKNIDNNKSLILNNNLNVEINSEVNLLSFVSKNNKLEIISKDEKIDTSTLGEKELIIKYKDKEEKEYKFKINIVDTIKPNIEYKKELTINEGEEIDLLKDVIVTDNSKEEIKVEIIGDYDINKEGIYNLKYIAKDSSNNKAEEDFTLIVNKKIYSNNNVANNTSDNTNNNGNTNTNNTNTNNNNNSNNNNSNNNNSNSGNESNDESSFNKEYCSSKKRNDYVYMNMNIGSEEFGKTTCDNSIYFRIQFGWDGFEDKMVLVFVQPGPFNDSSIYASLGIENNSYDSLYSWIETYAPSIIPQEKYDYYDGLSCENKDNEENCTWSTETATHKTDKHYLRIYY